MTQVKITVTEAIWRRAKRWMRKGEPRTEYCALALAACEAFPGSRVRVDSRVRVSNGAARVYRLDPLGQEILDAFDSTRRVRRPALPADVYLSPVVW